MTLSFLHHVNFKGHCAKYGTYSLMNMENNKIIALQLVQVRVISYMQCDILKEYSHLPITVHKNVTHNFW